MVMVLSRTYLPEGTNGTLTCNGALLCYTIELPWKENAKKISCIPEGYYLLRKRFSPKKQWHIEVVAVKNRSTILIHPANNAIKELKGCIAPVSKLTGDGCGLASRLAFATVKKQVYQALEEGQIVSLIVQS